jgi:hypothetical protein
MMGRPRRYETDADRQAAYRERQREEQDLDPGMPLTPEEEQEIRDFYGYAASETRTKAERDAIARRIVEKLSCPSP